jgi:hypothetical protein
VARGLIGAVAVIDRVDVGAALGVAVGVARRNDLAVGVTVADGSGVSFGLALEVGLADGASAGEAVGGANVDVEVGGIEVAAAACAGFTNVFGGPSGGGVDSDLIFARTFSAACRSGIASQP